MGSDREGSDCWMTASARDGCWGKSLQLVDSAGRLQGGVALNQATGFCWQAVKAAGVVVAAGSLAS